MTSSARTSGDCGIISPRALAALRLMISSKRFGRSTGSFGTCGPTTKIVSTFSRTSSAASVGRRVKSPRASRHGGKILSFHIARLLKTLLKRREQRNEFLGSRLEHEDADASHGRL